MPSRKILFGWGKKRSKKPTSTFADLSENDQAELKSRARYVFEEELKLQTRKYTETAKFDDLVEGLLHLSTLTCIYADSLHRCNENGVPAALKNTNRRARLNHLENTDLVRAEIETEAPPATVTAPVTGVEEPPAIVTAPVTDLEEPRDSEETRKAESEVEDKAEDQAEDQAEDKTEEQADGQADTQAEDPTEEQAADPVSGQVERRQLRIAPPSPQNDSHDARFRARAQERARARIQERARVRIQDEIDDGNQAVLSLK